MLAYDHEFECPVCNGEGFKSHALGNLPMEMKEICWACCASGWIKCEGPGADGCQMEKRGHRCECEAAWERQQEDRASEPPPSARERQEMAQRERDALRSGLPL